MTGSRRSGATLSTPNFLFFITDQQRWDHVGYAGNEIVQTPNIDRIAEGGSWLSRFYVSSPTCMSNRATFMTGRIPRVNGVRFNGIPLDLDSVTFVDLLLAAGYRTALVRQEPPAGHDIGVGQGARARCIRKGSGRRLTHWPRHGVRHM